MSDYFDQRLSSEEAPNSSSGGGSEMNSPLGALDEKDSSVSQETAGSIKAAVQELLKYGLVEASAKPNIYRELKQNPETIKRTLEPFDLQMALDEVRGIAFLEVLPAGEEADANDPWQHPLVRRQRLTTEQSLLVAILRQAYVAYEQTHGIGASDARIDFEELLAQFSVYMGSSGSDKADTERLRRVLTQLVTHGIASEPDKENQVAIRPIIVHLANPEHLALLLEHFRKLASNSLTSDTESEPNVEDEV